MYNVGRRFVNLILWYLDMIIRHLFPWLPEIGQIYHEKVLSACLNVLFKFNMFDIILFMKLGIVVYQGL